MAKLSGKKKEDPIKGLKGESLQSGDEGQEEP